MTKTHINKISRPALIAALTLSLGLAACHSSASEQNSDANVVENVTPPADNAANILPPPETMPANVSANEAHTSSADIDAPSQTAQTRDDADATGDTGRVSRADPDSSSTPPASGDGTSTDKPQQN
jgi:hypothetical protein